MHSDGYVKLQDILKLNMKTRSNIPLSSHAIDEIREAVRIDNKQRLSLMEEDGELWIRANQGHTIKVLLIKGNKELEQERSTTARALARSGSSSPDRARKHAGIPLLCRLIEQDLPGRTRMCAGEALCDRRSGASAAIFAGLYTLDRPTSR
uniref:2'-phosphotransferase n=1 Tax=Chenopodium quinoa TaxID=63459 RepID=A0A803LJP5_CHEQI